MMPRIAILILVSLALKQDFAFSVNVLNVSKTIPSGYTDNEGNYNWFEGKSELEFIDEYGKTWNKITDNKSNWNEAITIRLANINSLILIGYDSISVSRDVLLYDEESVLFTKLSRLQNSANYVADWRNALNSDNFTRTAKKSQRIKNKHVKTRLALKFYPHKSKIDSINAIGLVKTSPVSHSFEASMEIFEQLIKRILRNNDPTDDPIYDMHLKNAMKLERKMQKCSRVP